MKLILLLSSLMLSCTFADFKVTLMLPDGKLAKSTKLSLLSENTIENNKKVVPKLLQLTTSPQGVFEIPDTFFRKDTDRKSRSLIEAFLIDVPGYALHCYVWWLPQTIKLHKLAPITRKITAADGSPVAGASLEMIHIGIGSFAHFRMQSGFNKTTSDKQGNYTFRNVIHNDYDFPIGARVRASVKHQGEMITCEGKLITHMVGKTHKDYSRFLENANDYNKHSPLIFSQIKSQSNRESK